MLIHHNFDKANVLEGIKAEKQIIVARQIYLYLLAGILSEPIFGSDW